MGSIPTTRFSKSGNRKEPRRCDKQEHLVTGRGADPKRSVGRRFPPPAVLKRESICYNTAEDFDIRFWRRSGAAARFAATWAMVGDLQKMKGRRSRSAAITKNCSKIINEPPEDVPVEIIAVWIEEDAGQAA